MLRSNIIEVSSSCELFQVVFFILYNVGYFWNYDKTNPMCADKQKDDFYELHLSSIAELDIGLKFHS